MSPNQLANTLISPNDTIRRAIEIINAGSTQIALVVDGDHHLLGTVTDGDIRRGILKGVKLEEQLDRLMNDKPVTALVSASREEILTLMTSRSIKQVPLLDEQGRVAGLELIDHLLRTPVLKDNPAIILAGGQGIRLRPLTSGTPKSLLKIGGKPVLELILQQLRSNGFHRIFISVNYLGEQIKEYFGDGSGHRVSIQYLLESEPLGTAGPLSLMPKSIELPCLVVNGDLVTKVNFQHMLEFHQEGGFQLTLGVTEYPLQLPFGVVVTQDERVVEFQEKPEETRLINSGVYILEPSTLDIVPQDSYFNMNELIEKVIHSPGQSVGAFPIHEYWMDIGTSSDYQRAQREYPGQFSEGT